MEPEASCAWAAWDRRGGGGAGSGRLRVPRESERGREPEAVERRGATCELSFL